jgi:hypothetical protein
MCCWFSVGSRMRTGEMSMIVDAGISLVAKMPRPVMNSIS